MNNVMNQLSTLYSTNLVVGVIVTIFGLLLAYYMVYYVLHMVALFVMTIYSGIKMIPEIAGAKEATSPAAYDVPLDQGSFGYTMADGGEPVDEDEEEKEK